MGRWVLMAADCIVLPAGIVVHMLSTQSPVCACVPDIRGRHVRPLLLAKQAFYIENGQFATQQALEISMGSAKDINKGLQHYQVERRVEDFGEVAVVYAVPNDVAFQPQVGPIRGQPKPTYHSAVGAVMFDGSAQRFDEVICVSDEPIAQKLERPRYADGDFSCPEKTLEKARWEN